MIRQKNTKPKPIPEYLLITEAQYEEWQQKIEEVEITNEVCTVITHIRKNLKTEAKKEEMEEMDFYISDRRWKKCVHLLQARTDRQIGKGYRYGTQEREKRTGKYKHDRA